MIECDPSGRKITQNRFRQGNQRREEQDDEQAPLPNGHARRFASGLDSRGAAADESQPQQTADDRLRLRNPAAQKQRRRD